MWLNFTSEDCGGWERLSFTVGPEGNVRSWTTASWWLGTCLRFLLCELKWYQVQLETFMYLQWGFDCWFIVSPSFWEADVGSKLAQCEEKYSARAIIRGSHAWKENTSPTESSSQLLWSPFMQTVCHSLQSWGCPHCLLGAVWLCFTCLGL